jgi:hypothetical protein
MSNQVYALALESTLQEIQNACPDVTSNFIFKDYEVLAKTENTSDATVTQTRNAFNDIAEKADAIGGLESITIQGAEGKVNIAALNDFHLTTVSSKQADDKYVNTLTRVLIPIVIKIVDEIQSALPETENITSNDEAYPTLEPEPVEPEVPETEVPEESSEELASEAEDATNEPIEEPEPVELEVYDEPLLPEPPVTQLMVENLGGLLVPSDTVRIGQDVIAQWKELYSDKKISEVEVEALNGKSTRCKVKQIKKSKDSGKGIIKMPEKIQLTLETASGELVTVKPVVE